MKKVTTWVLIVLSIIFLTTLVVYKSIISNDDIEIRVTWFSMVVSAILTGSAAFILASLAYKTALANKTMWAKITMIVFYGICTSAAIFVLILQLYNTDARMDMFVSLFFTIIGLTALSLLIFIKKSVWTKWFLFAHCIILGVLMLTVTAFIFVVGKEDKVKEDLQKTHISQIDKSYIVRQLIYGKETQFVILKDFGIFRKRKEINALPDGKWTEYNEHNEPIANITVVNREVNKEFILPDNSLLATNIEELKAAINENIEDSIVIYLDGDFELGKTFYINNKSNIIFSKLPGKRFPEFRINNKPTFIISKSTDIEFRQIEFKSENSSKNIEIIGSERIKFSSCLVNGISNTSVIIDDESKKISFQKTEFRDYTNHAIIALVGNVGLSDNTYDWERIPQSIMLKDVSFDKNFQNRLLSEILFSDEIEGYSYNEDYVRFDGKKFGKFKGTFLDVYNTQWNINDVLTGFLSREFCDDCGCEYTYDYTFCSRFFNHVANRSFFISEKQNFHDNWSWDDEGEPKFKHANPEFFQWITDSISLNPEDEIKGFSLQSIYNKLFKNFFRDQVIVYNTSKEIENLEERIEWYKNYVDLGMYDIGRFVYKNFMYDSPFEINESFFEYEEEFESDPMEEEMNGEGDEEMVEEGEDFLDEEEPYEEEYM
ncbi:MAG: DMT family transporter, partial [Bacteroidales bacterium]|nr:DMT family transporter [Bacteroidales bacterium]